MVDAEIASDRRRSQAAHPAAERFAEWVRGQAAASEPAAAPARQASR